MKWQKNGLVYRLTAFPDFCSVFSFFHLKYVSKNTMKSWDGFLYPEDDAQKYGDWFLYPKHDTRKYGDGFLYQEDAAMKFCDEFV